MGTTGLQSLQETDDQPLSRREAGEAVGVAGQDQGQRLFARGRWRRTKSQLRSGWAACTAVK